MRRAGLLICLPGRPARARPLRLVPGAARARRRDVGAAARARVAPAGAPAGDGARRRALRDDRRGDRARSSGASTATGSHNLPLFVPPAHGLVYLTGIAIAAALEPRARCVVIAAAAARGNLGPARPLRPAAPRRRRRGRDPAPARLPLALPQPRGLRERLPGRRGPRALRHGARDLALGADAPGTRDPGREPAVGRRVGLRLVRRDGAARRAPARGAAQNSVEASRAAPTCSRPSSVSTRPRGVRCRKPSCSR